jgi:hypothetical protein
MEKYWKITNTGKESKIKFTIALASDKSPGGILKEDEFVVSQPRITTMLDAQEKRGFVSIDRSFTNPDGIPIGEVRKLSEGELAAKKVAQYKS